MATLGFLRRDFEVFAIDDFSARMAKIYELIRPRLIKLGNELAPQLSRKLDVKFSPHVPKHMRSTAKPPDETWTAFGPSQAGYKRYGYLALCISSVGIHARAIVKSEADQRSGMAQMIKSQADELARSFHGTRIQQYQDWEGRKMPASTVAGPAFFDAIAVVLAKKSGGLDVGFGWPVRDALTLDRAEVLDAFRELEPLYRLIGCVK
jgi:uncharacterized protein YktB (UPF0637 family)